MAGAAKRESRVRWGWAVTGGGTILLFALLMALRLGLWNFTPLPPAAQLASPAAPAGGSDAWLAITQNGRRIGYANRSFAKTEQGYRFSEVLTMQINTMGVVQPLTVRTTATLNPDRTLADFHFELASTLLRFSARGKAVGRTLTVHLGTPGEERVSTLPLDEPVYLGGGIMDAVASLQLQPGERRTFALFDPASLGRRPATLTFLGEESLTMGGKSQRARRYALEFMGMKQTAWTDGEGVVLREEGMLGIALERVGREAALAGADMAATNDLVELAAIPSPQPIERPETLGLLRVRLTGLGERISLAGDRQSVRDGVLTIRREGVRPEGAPSEGVGGALVALLAPSPLIQSDHPRIRRQAAAIVTAADGPEEKARKIVAWVYRSLEKRPVLSVPSALETLDSRIGDCNEHAVLTAALARAAGIPAAVEAGLVYQRGRFYYHAWNALHLPSWGGWVTADATLGQFPADVTHIRLVRGEADRQLDLLGLIGRLKLDSLEVAP